MNLCLTSVKFYLFLFFLDILVSRCLTGGVAHELVFDISEVLPILFFLDILVSRCLTGGVTHELVFDISEVLAIFVLFRYIGVKMSDKR